jgi:hypothetical protein
VAETALDFLAEALATAQLPALNSQSNQLRLPGFLTVLHIEVDA